MFNLGWKQGILVRIFNVPGVGQLLALYRGDMAGVGMPNGILVSVSSTVA
jgi:hypothetical protein